MDEADQWTALSSVAEGSEKAHGSKTYEDDQRTAPLTDASEGHQGADEADRRIELFFQAVASDDHRPAEEDSWTAALSVADGAEECKTTEEGSLPVLLFRLFLRL